MKPKEKHLKFYFFLNDFIPKSWVCLQKGYSWNFFRKDAIAGMTVGVVALPLAMAFAIASGLPPAAGLYTSIIAGFLISLLGGTYFQVGGPTGAFVVIIYNIVATMGYDGLFITTIMAGIILIIAALSKMGSLIKYVPYPLIAGFTTGIGVVIFFSQIKDFLGLQIDNVPSDFIPKCIALYQAFPSWSPLTLTIAASTLILIILIRKYIPTLPWGIASIIIITGITWVFKLPLDTIASRFGDLPRSLPFPCVPKFSQPISNWHIYFTNAITIAFLAGIESLLSAIVADGMSGRRHKSNCELMAQGIANIVSVLFGGLTATGALARTATNIRSGAKTPFAGVFHSVTIFLIILLLAPVVSKIPIAALSGVLIMVAWNMSEIKNFRHLFKAPIGDVVVLLTTFFLTVIVNLVTAIAVGMILAAFLFMNRMNVHSGVYALSSLTGEETESEKLGRDAIFQKQIPQMVEVYEVTGLFFFGLADSL